MCCYKEDAMNKLLIFRIPIYFRVAELDRTVAKKIYSMGPLPCGKEVVTNVRVLDPQHTKALSAKSYVDIFDWCKVLQPFLLGEMTGGLAGFVYEFAPGTHVGRRRDLQGTKDFTESVGVLNIEEHEVLSFPS